jgi:MinD superfamily P-loop ATPase
MSDLENAIICFAGGKGGTGKTTVAANVAASLAKQSRAVTYLDCDVEEPNGHLFLHPHIESRQRVTVPVPKVDRDRCISCGQCTQTCQFQAITVVNNHVLLFPELCHSCGGCRLVCPKNAIEEVPQEIGTVELGYAGNMGFVQGELDIQQVKTPPTIQAVKQHIPETGIAILDAPPGTSCPVVETLQKVDYLVLVAEPTPFGLHDLQLVVEMARLLHLNFGVVINRAGWGDRQLYNYLEKENIPLLGEIPNDKAIATAYTKGQLAVDALPQYRDLFAQIAEAIVQKTGLGKELCKN